MPKLTKMTKKSNVIHYNGDIDHDRLHIIHYNGDIDHDRLHIILTKYCSHLEIVKNHETLQDTFRLTLSRESLVNMLNHVEGEIPTDSEKENKIDSLLNEIKTVTKL